MYEKSNPEGQRDEKRSKPHLGNRRRSEQRAAEEKNARAGKKKKSSVDVDVDVDVGHRSAPFVCSLITNTDVEDDAGNP